MKISISIVAIIVLIGCFQNENDNPNSQLIGEWNWIQSTGGFAGTTETPESTGNEISIVFTDSIFKRFVNGILDTEENYTIELGESIRNSEETELIIYEYRIKQSFENIDDTLMLYDECIDGYTSKYMKE